MARVGGRRLHDVASLDRHEARLGPRETSAGLVRGDVPSLLRPETSFGYGLGIAAYRTVMPAPYPMELVPWERMMQAQALPCQALVAAPAKGGGRSGGKGRDVAAHRTRRRGSASSFPGGSTEAGAEAEYRAYMEAMRAASADDYDPRRPEYIVPATDDQAWAMQGDLREAQAARLEASLAARRRARVEAAEETPPAPAVAPPPEAPEAPAEAAGHEAGAEVQQAEAWAAQAKAEAAAIAAAKVAAAAEVATIFPHYEAVLLELRREAEAARCQAALARPRSAGDADSEQE